MSDFNSEIDFNRFASNISGCMECLSIMEGSGFEKRASCYLSSRNEDDFFSIMVNIHKDVLLIHLNEPVQELYYSYEFFEKAFNRFFLNNPFGLIAEAQIESIKFYIINNIVDKIDFLIGQFGFEKNNTIVRYAKTTVINKDNQEKSSCDYIGVLTSQGYLIFSLHSWAV